MEWAGHAARMGDTRNGHKILIGKPVGGATLWRHRRW